MAGDRKRDLLVDELRQAVGEEAVERADLEDRALEEDGISDPSGALNDVVEQVEGRDKSSS